MRAHPCALEWMHRSFPKPAMYTLTRSLLLLALLPLAGCVQDSASYSFPEKNHAITLVRNQDWFWQNTLQIRAITVRLPECNGGLDIAKVPVDAPVELYQAPDVYPEPLFLLKIGKRVFAASTQSCRVQRFDAAPPDLGKKMGAFRVKDGTFQFVPAEPGDS